MSGIERLGRAWLGLTLAFLLAPVVVLLVDSISSATSFPSPFETATLRWYIALFHREDFLDGAWRSLEVALLAAAVATSVSFLAAYGLSRTKLPGRHAIATALMGPLFVPEIVLGFAILQIVGMLGVEVGLVAISLTHAVFVMPFVLRLVLAAFSRFDFNLEDAARSLGARPLEALRHVTIPIVRPSLVAGFMLSAILSFVNLPLSMFLTNAGTATLPVAMFAYMESRMDPMIAAAGTLIIVLAAVATLLLDRVLRVRKLSAEGEAHLAYLELRNVTKLYRDVTAVADLSLSVTEGEMLCLLGPSGCGKTTTLRIVAGFEAVSAGMITLGGRELTHVPSEGRDIGLVFQNYALFPHMTVDENIAFGLKMRRQTPQRIASGVAEALRLVRLEGVGGRYPRELSGGQQQRVALARAIAIKPRLLLLDEPLSNLDAKLRDIMRDEIRRLQRELGITAIFVTHDQIEALAMADRMAVMDRGRVVQVDTPARIYERPAHPFVAEFIGEANRWHGRVLSQDRGDVLVELAGGMRLRGVSDAAPSPGSAAIAVVKTERVGLSRLRQDGESVAIEARILARTFLGATTVYRCDAAGMELTAALTHSPGDGFAIGEAVFASWRSPDCLIIAAGDA